MSRWRFAVSLLEQKESAKLDGAIVANLREIGYGG